MRKKLLWALIPAALIGLFSFSILQHQSDTSLIKTEKEEILKQALFKSLEQAHFNKITVDDAFSANAFKLFIKKLDPNKRIFTQSDYEKLLSHQFSIDDEMQGKSNPLFDEAMDILSVRLDKSKSYYREILDHPFDFTVEETIELDADKRNFATDSVSLKEEWRKYLKYTALVRYNQKRKENQSKAKKAMENGTEFTLESDQVIEENIRAEVLKSLDSRYDAIEKLTRDEYLAEYLNSILAVYGPHTEFFPPKEKEDFDIRMSGRMEGIGAQLSQTEGTIKVTQIVPGSPSWKGKELQEGDIILKVAQGDEEAVSVVEMPLRDAVSLIRGKKGTEVQLTVKKKDGRITTISIIRDEVVLEESYAKSAVIDDTNTDIRYGFIDLPSFYANFNDKNGRSSATDVKNELLSLKSQNVDAVVLDLRNNGGGSLTDAVEMSGLFIKDGPIVQVKDSFGRKTIHEDNDQDVVWDGPLIILMNNFSASASEILAAAMQDYGRAVIVGTPRSFGKGTVQRFIDLDYSITSYYSAMKPFGSVKLTIQKFYRINGGATQVRGVEPDILMPDIYNYLDFGESSLDHVLPWGEIEPSEYTKWNASVNSMLPTLAEKSKMRTDGNEVFSMIEQNALRLKEQQDKTLQSLNLEAFIAEQEQLEAEAKKFDNIGNTHTNLKVTPLSQLLQKDKTLTRLDSAKLSSLEDWKVNLGKDVYVYEATRIAEDMLDQTQKISMKTKEVGIKED